MHPLYPLQGAFNCLNPHNTPREEGKATLISHPFTAEEVNAEMRGAEMSLENPILRATPLLVQVWATGQDSSIAWKTGRNAAPCRPCPRLNKAECALKSHPQGVVCTLELERIAYTALPSPCSGPLEYIWFYLLI